MLSNGNIITKLRDLDLFCNTPKYTRKNFPIKATLCLIDLKNEIYFLFGRKALKTLPLPNM